MAAGDTEQRAALVFALAQWFGRLKRFPLRATSPARMTALWGMTKVRLRKPGSDRTRLMPLEWIRPIFGRVSPHLCIFRAYERQTRRRRDTLPKSGRILMPCLMQQRARRACAGALVLWGKYSVHEPNLIRSSGR